MHALFCSSEQYGYTTDMYPAPLNHEQVLHLADSNGYIEPALSNKDLPDIEPICIGSETVAHDDCIYYSLG